MRDHYVHPPPRVIDGILVFDAAALTRPPPAVHIHHDRLKCPGTASGLHDDDVIDDELINRAIERPWGLKAVPGGDQRKADIVCIDKRGRYVYICDTCNYLDHVLTWLVSQSVLEVKGKSERHAKMHVILAQHGSMTHPIERCGHANREAIQMRTAPQPPQALQPPQPSLPQPSLPLPPQPPRGTRDTRKVIRGAKRKAVLSAVDLRRMAQ